MSTSDSYQDDTADNAKPDLTRWQEELESGRDVSVAEHHAFDRAQYLADQDAMARAEQEYQAGSAWTQDICDLWPADGESGAEPRVSEDLDTYDRENRMSRDRDGDAR
jgi:hypothetical protein